MERGGGLRIRLWDLGVCGGAEGELSLGFGMDEYLIRRWGWGEEERAVHSLEEIFRFENG